MTRRSLTKEEISTASGVARLAWFFVVTAGRSIRGERVVFGKVQDDSDTFQKMIEVMIKEEKFTIEEN